MTPSWCGLANLGQTLKKRRRPSARSKIFGLSDKADLGTRDAGLVAGPYFAELLTESSWKLRQVQTFKYIDLPSVSVQTSLTIDGRDVIKRAHAHKMPVGDYLDIPLGIFPKALFGAFDLQYADGKCLPLMHSAYDSWVAVGVLATVLRRGGLPDAYITEGLLAALYEVCRKHDGDGFSAKINWIAENSEELENREGEVEALLGAEIFSVINQVENSYNFVQMLRTFSDQFIPIVRLSSKSVLPSSVLKYSQVTNSPEMELLPFSSFRKRKVPGVGYLQIRTVNLGLAGSQHFRASAPDGTVIIDASAQNPAADRETTVPHLVHITPRWASLYSGLSNDVGSVDVKLALVPEVRSFSFPAFASLLISMGVLATGVLLNYADLSWEPARVPRLSSIALTSSGSVIALLLVLPSLYLLALVRKDEHAVASSLLRFPRYALGFAALSIFLSAVPASFSMSSTTTAWIWVSALIVCSVVFIIVILHYLRIERLTRNAKRHIWNRDESRGGMPLVSE